MIKRLNKILRELESNDIPVIVVNPKEYENLDKTNYKIIIIDDIEG